MSEWNVIREFTVNREHQKENWQVVSEGSALKIRCDGGLEEDFNEDREWEDYEIHEKILSIPGISEDDEVFEELKPIIMSRLIL
jgi:hypothetical protein